MLTVTLMMYIACGIKKQTNILRPETQSGLITYLSRRKLKTAKRNQIVMIKSELTPITRRKRGGKTMNGSNGPGAGGTRRAGGLGATPHLLA